MKCENIQFNLSVYADDILRTDERAIVDAHLAQCPLCRQKLSDFQLVRHDLRILSRPQMPADLLVSLRNRVADELETARQKRSSIFTESLRAWMQIHLIPYSIATVITLVFGLTLLWSLLSAARDIGQNTELARVQTFNKPTVLLSNNSSTISNEFELTASDYAAARLSVSGDSPSVNPKGALIALTKSLVRGNMKDDEVVVVADVFGNGLAQIAEVVEPSSDRRAVRELENALKNNPDFAPFVPATLDGRSDTVRVVLKIQHVDVQTHLKPRKH
ncbi:MAG: zf-HC2 domain-containing protein [Acidobacteriota bacterium]|nr:zf-HC2 domain-containing protein [Acidobacteriota bacterium]